MKYNPATMSESVKLFQGADTLEALGLQIADTKRTLDAAKPPVPKRSKMSKTEARYLNEVLRPMEHAGLVRLIKFQPVTWHLENGHRYTPDFSFIQYGFVNFVEVKGSYKLQSYRSARIAFDQAALEWPMFHWIWAELKKDGTWKTTTR